MSNQQKEKSLNNKAIEIKGRQYVLVSDRVLYFNEQYPEGSIITKLIKYEDQQVIVKAIIKPDIKTDRKFTGYAQEIIGDGYINKTSALENAETSAVGRALAMMGIGVIDSIASVDEINKAENKNYTIKKQDPELTADEKKQCPICKKWHTGKYPKCFECWVASKKKKEAPKTDPLVNKEKPPFPEESIN